MVAGLVIGGWVASAVISKLITELVEYGKKKPLGLNGVELERLETNKRMIEAVLDGTDPVLIREEENPKLQEWLWQMRDAVEQAYNVLDNSLYDLAKEKVKAGKNKVSSEVVPEINTLLQRAVEKDPSLTALKKAVKAINSVAANAGQFSNLVIELKNKQKEMNKSTKTNRETSPVLNAGTHESVREKERADIIQRLLKPERKTNSYSILPIIGQGPVGKTTLAQLVYNDPDVKRHFPLRMWVCINTDFNVEELTKKLYESVFKKKPDSASFATIHRKLSDELKSNKFLVVFDDAWDDSKRAEWDKLLGPFEKGARGSMILLTTRMKSVAELVGPNRMNPVFLKGYNNGDMWHILKSCAFRGKNPNCRGKLVKIGKDIMKDLEGSAQAAKAVGEILHSDLSEEHWKDILKSKLWSLKEVQNCIMPELILTYQKLPSYLKCCFSFCGIFPPNHFFIRRDLINMWIALGLVSNYHTGTKHFEDMLKRSIFIRARDTTPLRYYSKDEQHSTRYVMPHLMRELSKFISQDECLRTYTHQNKLVCIPNKIRHLYVYASDPRKLSISNTSNLKNLHTLILRFDESNNPDMNAINGMLKAMKNLRILTLIAPNLSEFPENASNLLHLRYLRLIPLKLRALPQSMSKLYLLETKVFNKLSPGV